MSFLGGDTAGPAHRGLVSDLSWRWNDLVGGCSGTDKLEGENGYDSRTNGEDHKTCETTPPTPNPLRGNWKRSAPGTEVPLGVLPVPAVISRWRGHAL